MGNFSEVLDRLKHELRVSKDQEVADFLGMSKTAFAERKRREVFPEEKLLAVAPEHPGVDVGYVLRGFGVVKNTPRRQRRCCGARARQRAR